MTQLQATSLFQAAEIQVLAIEPLVNGYSHQPGDPRFYEKPPAPVWWFVKTPVGWVKIGWRKRVINIDWTDTPVRKIITQDDVTKTLTYVHAWSLADALKYLVSLKNEIHGALYRVQQSCEVYALPAEEHEKTAAPSSKNLRNA